MSMESFEDARKRMEMYENIALSEQQIRGGKVKDARESLDGLRECYDL